MAIVGKFPPVLFDEPRFATGRSAQFKPLGSLTLGIGGPNATGKQRPIKILFRSASSWTTKTCLTGVGSVTYPPPPSGWPKVVATGLTSLLPIMPSSQPSGLLTLFAGPNSIPAVASPPGSGERYITRIF